MKIGPSETLRPKPNRDIKTKHPEAEPKVLDSFSQPSLGQSNELNGVVNIGAEPDHEKPWWSAELYEQWGSVKPIDIKEGLEQKDYLELCQVLRSCAVDDGHLQISIF